MVPSKTNLRDHIKEIDDPLQKCEKGDDLRGGAGSNTDGIPLTAI